MKHVKTQSRFWAIRALIGVCFICIVSATGYAKTYELSFATQHPAEAPMNKVVNKAWINYLEKASKGKMKITLYPAEQIAKAPELYDAALMGLADISDQMLPYNPGRWTVTGVTQLPFLFEFPGSRAAALATMELYNKYPEIQAEFKGVKILGFHATGLNHIHTTNRPVHSLENMKGLLLMSPGKIAVNLVKSLGGTPTAFMPSEAYDSLAKGVSHGNLMEWEGHHIWHFNELTKYSTQASMALYVFVHAMNLDTWNSLPPDLQELIDGSIGMFHQLHGYVFDKGDIMFRGLLDKQYKSKGTEGIYVLPKNERERWVKAAQPVFDEWVKDAGKKVGESKARQILDDAKKLAKKYDGYPDKACPKCENELKRWMAP